MTTSSAVKKPEPADPIAAFTAALDEDVRAGLRITRSIAYHLECAIREHGWTPQQLATEANRDLDTAANVGAVITERLRVAATIPPPGSRKTISRGRPFCTPECRDNQGLILDPDTRMPTGKCPCRTPPKETTD